MLTVLGGLLMVLCAAALCAATNATRARPASPRFAAASRRRCSVRSCDAAATQRRLQAYASSSAAALRSPVTSRAVKDQIADLAGRLRPVRRGHERLGASLPRPLAALRERITAELGR